MPPTAYNATAPGEHFGNVHGPKEGLCPCGNRAPSFLAGRCWSCATKAKGVRCDAPGLPEIPSRLPSLTESQAAVVAMLHNAGPLTVGALAGCLRRNRADTQREITLLRKRNLVAFEAGCYAATDAGRRALAHHDAKAR